MADFHQALEFEEAEFGNGAMSCRALTINGQTG
jgi:hypothetical protein